MGNSVNRKIAQKKASKKRPQTWKPGQSGNPKGAPKRGDSWAETIKAIGEMDGPSIAALWDTQHKEFGKLPDGISMKQLVVMTVYAALLREPSPGNWRELMDRAEGKVSQPVEVYDWRTEARKQGYDPDQLYRDLVAAARARLVQSSDSGSDTGSGANAVIDSSRSEDAA